MVGREEGHNTRRCTMSNAMSLRVPEYLYDQAKALAAQEGVSLNQYVMLALAEKVAREEALGHLKARLFQYLDEWLAAQQTSYTSLYRR
ncbi:MAG: toxin-antitoxin system HicB family antitoxin [Chloroflexota bacterium]